MEDVSVIGLGVVGGAIFREVNKKIKCYGVDINNSTLEIFGKEGYNVGKEIKESKIYIIIVYTTDQVFDVLNKINYNKNPLVVIESTLDISRIDELEKLLDEKNFNNLVIFSHRFNPNDPEHYIFNLDRVIGAYSKEALDKALGFYKQFMDEKLIHIYDPRIAILCKPIENAYRFVEIAIAESLKMNCDRLGINFNKLRESINTKWNIDVKETRGGIGRSCLPKDMKIVSNYFNDNEILKKALEVDKVYKNYTSTLKAKKNKKGMISLIIRTFNGEGFIKNSIESALNQDFNNYEVIVINDGSTDNTLNIIKPFLDKIRLINQENKGLIESGHIGFNSAFGEYVIFLDGDDKLEKNALSELFNALESNKQCVFSYCDYHEVDLRDSINKIVSINNLFESIACGILFKKSVIEKIGFWDRGLIFPEYDLFVRLIKKNYKGIHIKKPLYIYNRHYNSYTNNKERVEKGRKQILDKYGKEVVNILNKKSNIF